MSETMADDFCSHDHRRVVNAGVLRGRDVNIANMRAVAEVGFEGLKSTVIATRGQRLALGRIRSSAHGFNAGEISADMLGMFEIDVDNRLISAAIFDSDDIDAAFTELDARYLAGEAANSRTWEAVMTAYAAINRGQLPLTTTHFEDIDHRRGPTMLPGDLMKYLRAALDDSVGNRLYIKTVHRLTERGVVVTHVAKGTAREGLDAEWRMNDIYMVEGDLISRCEIFDDADLDATLSRFDELQPQLANAASQVAERFLADLVAGDWDAMAEMLTDDFRGDDRRRVVGAGVRHGRDAEIADVQAIAGLGVTSVASSVMATRGRRVALLRVRFSFRDHGPEAFLGELLGIVEINTDNRMLAYVGLDLDDIDAAFTELDARYLAGEAAAHARTWSATSRAFEALNRGELPSTAQGFVDIDHRRGATLEPGALFDHLRVAFAESDHITIYIAAVHRLTSVGAVITHVTKGASREGFYAEWRIHDVVALDGDLINRAEFFDETELDAALARFDELESELSNRRHSP
ncbi:hypothetical protein [Mycobacterium montefiorense]|uniref:hypothetical protein n=1 Tax=Mycobacterium montefiorense TaxID=154654 RepID=UPI0021DC6B22|nr:hypothetical protein [Mycobacterium montefiorense]GLE50717.1 hypothetical protein ATCCBAA256_03040 [Mycobacterium montefiorense]